jgi:hypothetical protein
VAGQVNYFFFKTSAVIKKEEVSEIKKGQLVAAPFSTTDLSQVVSCSVLSGR